MSETEMSEIPKIVRQRLQQSGPALRAHPDANVLNAFAEQCLTGLERIAVLDHLSSCAECREVVALALPASESLQPALQFSSRPKLTWPILRWGLTSAGVLALALLGFVEYGHRGEPARMAKNSPPPAAEQVRPEAVPAAPARDEAKANEERSQPAPTASGRAASTEEKDANESAGKMELTRNFSTPGARGALAHGPRQSNQWQQQNANAIQTPSRVQNLPDAKQPVPPPSGSGKSEMVEVQSAATQLDVQSEPRDSLVAGNKPMPQPAAPSASDSEVSRAKSAPAAVSSPAVSGLTTQGRAFQALQLINPTWTVNAGRLQRSFDQGQTWQEVNVLASSDAGASLEVAAVSSKADRVRKDKKATSIAPVFRAVAANGQDVWAGGNAGMVYHSADAGAHWMRITPSSQTGALTGDVLSLEFPDLQNGKISTSTGEIWVTADGGQSWQRQ